MATKKQILNQIDVIEKKLPNGEMKELSDVVVKYQEQTLEDEKKMLLMKNDIKHLRDELTNY